jgi:heptosyltransferase-2
MRFSAAGDVILIAPVLQALARAWPHSQLWVITHERYAPLVQHHPHVAGIIALRPRESLKSLLERARAARIDAVCDLHGSWRSRALALGLGVRRISRWRKRTLYTLAAHHLAHAPYRPEQPMAARYHAAAEALVGRSLPPEPLRFDVSLVDRAAGQGLLTHVNAEAHRPLIGLLPGAAWATKRWPTAHFVTIARALLARGDQVVVLGSGQEAPLTAAIVAGAPGALDLGVDCSWGAMGHVLGRCAAVVAGDTGPMHLARAVGTPCVVLFGSTPASQFDLQGHVALSSDVHCSPCSFHGLAACPRGHLRCMNELSTDRVLAALDVLRQRCDSKRP